MGETQIAVRLENELITKLDAEVERIARESGMKMSRTNYIRMIIFKHFEEKEALEKKRKK